MVHKSKIMKKIILVIAFFQFILMHTHAQYNSCAGQSIAEETRETITIDQNSGKKIVKIEKMAVKDKDDFGNAKGNQYDLAVDGAFEGQTIVVLNFVNIDLTAPTLSLKEKGLSVVQFSPNTGGIPTLNEFQKALDKSCQFWLISSHTQQLTEEHAEIIKRYFESGKGVYIWGDNTPLHADANFITQKLLGVWMDGEYYGDKAVGFKSGGSDFGLRENHLNTIGLESVYEGITISQIHDDQQVMTPLIWSTDGNVVSAFYENQGRRLIIDGGFTRLFYKWESAGTDRYIKNAAAWLVNYERFGESVVGLK